MDGEIALDFDVSQLTTDQHGMLELLGKPRVQEYRVIAFHLDPPTFDGVPTIARGRTLHYRCPVVRVLGRDRIVLPNGDLVECEG